MKKVLDIFVAIILCISIFSISGCMNKRSMKFFENTISYISIVAGAVSIVDWIMGGELKMKNGREVWDLKELQKHFSMAQVMKYYDTSKVLKGLNELIYEDEEESFRRSRT